MDEATLEKYVQLITDKVSEVLSQRESKVKEECTSAQNIPESSSCAVLTGKRLVTEQEVLEIIAKKQKELVCDSNTIITALAMDRIKSEGITVVKK